MSRNVRMGRVHKFIHADVTSFDWMAAYQKANLQDQAERTNISRPVDIPSASRPCKETLSPTYSILLTDGSGLILTMPLLIVFTAVIASLVLIQSRSLVGSFFLLTAPVSSPSVFSSFLHPNPGRELKMKSTIAMRIMLNHSDCRVSLTVLRSNSRVLCPRSMRASGYPTC
ncbi:hypothetical protein BX666DRAFT_1380452 [Dichotomocladium elegans]|nr:hypothetical protein BX666DRAFT_1380452 [Dichotomocladium elegans]